MLKNAQNKKMSQKLDYSYEWSKTGSRIKT